jgi:hypothetical protein
MPQKRQEANQTQSTVHQQQYIAQPQQGGQHLTVQNDMRVPLAISIATLGRQLSDLADHEKDPATRSDLQSKTQEIIDRAVEIAGLNPDAQYITVPPDWKPPQMMERCPNCDRMRSKSAVAI